MDRDSTLETHTEFHIINGTNVLL